MAICVVRRCVKYADNCCVAFPLLLCFLMLLSMGDCYAADYLSSFNLSVWIRAAPASFRELRNPTLSILPGKDIVLFAAGKIGDNRRATIAMRFFSGQTAIWTDEKDEPAWAKQSVSAVNGPADDNHTLFSGHTTISFHYPEGSGEPFAGTSAGFRGALDMPNRRKEPAANWIESSGPKGTEGKVLVFPFAHPESPPDGGPCSASQYEGKTLFTAPYNQIHAVDPLLQGVVLQDGT